MGIPVLTIGQPGQGKSTSIRNFGKTEVGIFNVASKPLPFKNDLDVISHATYQTIYQSWERAKAKNALRKAYVVDDADYLMTFQAFARAKEIGYQKFTDIAVDFYNLIQYIINGLPDDVIVYILMHTEQTEQGVTKAKTTGKMIDNQLSLEGLFTIVLLAQTDGTDHWFVTQSDGYTTVKSPMGMFPARIDNDLKLVDTTIREYYNLNKEDKKDEA